MADDTVQTETPIRSATDLEIEKLNARLESIERSYQDRINELESANRSLWAQLHPVQTVAEPQPVVESDQGEEALIKALGLK